jgi:hypothetical protein
MVVHTNDAVEWVFFVVKVFTLQEVTITLRCTVINMPVNYTIDNVDAKAVLIKTSGSEKMQLANFDEAGKKDKIAICD